MFAEVLPLGLPLSSTFHYSIPDELADKLAAGHLVEVSFGQQRVQGIVVTLDEDAPQGVSDFKPVEALLDEQPVLTRHQLDLGYYLSRHYLAPLADCLALMLPPGLAKQGDTEYELADVKFDAETDAQFRILQLLEGRGPLRGKQLDRALPKRNWRAAATTLVKRGAIKKRPVLQPPSVRPKNIRTARLLVPPAEVASAKFRLRHSPRHADLLDYLFSLWPGQPALPDFLRVTQSTEADLGLLVERGWIEITQPEPVIAPTYPVEVMQKWIAKHEAHQPEAASALRALCEGRAVPLAELPTIPLEVIKALDQQDMLRYSVNPPRIVLKLTGAQLAKQTDSLRKPSKRAAVLDYLAKQNKPVSVSWVYAETDTTLATLKELAERDLIDLGEEELLRDPLADKIFVPTEPPALTADQEEAWEAVEAAFALTSAGASVSQPPFLLHGITGSGKTEIYLRAVGSTLEGGRQAIILVPEIALTPQTVQRFASRFPGRVGVIHSGLTEGERYDTWRRARAGAIEVIIGPRSALFAPLPNIGLIVLDEEHDEAYQQDPPITPSYHARDAAVEYARRLGAICILGSATPDIVSFAKAQRGDYRLLELPQRIMAHGEYIAAQQSRLNLESHYRPISTDNDVAQYIDLPQTTLVDMRQELRAGNRSIFSRALEAALLETLERGEQAILFLNRRGSATYVFCRDCGQALVCSKCGMPLTFHGDEAQLQCHHCGVTRRQPNACPNCKSKRVKYFGAGTERVEAELRALFPEVRALRWDRDTTKTRGAHEIILHHFREHQAEVLIGTQMIAKGLDLPLVTLVGVVSADVGLNLPDYRAAERVFQVLTQVAGRAGRSMLGGRVIIQSYQPEHYAVQAAAAHDFAGFYEKETAYRREHGYPPFGRLVRLTYRHPKPDRAETEAQRVAAIVRAQMKRAEAQSTALIGPAPCFFDRIAGEYRWQIVLRGPNPAPLVAGLALKDWRVEVDPLSLL
ncbi:MAG: primosomal protein N' [Chloroflexi bacterium]|nr:primosomal protein N' [Chloroflexota bacterium]